jgi:hypothetical protein
MLLAPFGAPGLVRSSVLPMIVHVRGPSDVMLLSKEIVPTPSPASAHGEEVSSLLGVQSRESQPAICAEDKEHRPTRQKIEAVL